MHYMNHIFRRYKRLMLILVLTHFFVFLWTYIFLNSSLLDDFRKQYFLIDPMRSFAQKDDLLTTVQPIREKLHDLFEKEELSYTSLYFEYLNTGANISINQDVRILTASLIKVPLAMAVMKKIEKGDWKLYNELILTKEDRDNEWWDVYKRPIGTPISIQDLIEEMLLNSDNTAYRILYRNLSMDEVRDVFVALGLDDFFDQEWKITAKEYTRLLRSLYTANYLNLDHSQFLLEVLSRTTYDEYLGQGVPEDAIFSHKIGENTQKTVILDAGLVYIGDRVYLISMSMDYQKEWITREKALELFGYVSRTIYNYISTTRNEAL